MAVVHVGNRPNRSGRASSRRHNLLFETLGRRYIRELIVITNHPGDGPKTILTDGLVIAAGAEIGASYESFNDSDAIATCVDIDVQPTDNPMIWYLVVEYDTDRVVSAVVDNPLNQPPEIRRGGIKYEHPVIIDGFGISTVNSAKEPFDPPIVWNETRRVVTITRNEATFDSSIIETYTDSVNADTFQGRPPYTVRINNIQEQQMIGNGIEYHQVVYELELSSRGFFFLAKDQGFRDIDRRLFRDPRDLTPYSNPTLLNGRGRGIWEAVAEVAGPIDDSQTTITLVTGSDIDNFPPGPSDGTPHTDYSIKLNNEVMLVTGFDEGLGQWTVTRGYAGTTAAAHPDGGDATLEPYYLKFLQHPAVNFASLSLPTI